MKKCWTNKLILMFLLFIISCNRKEFIPLTQGEEEFFEKFFNGTINISRVKIYEGNTDGYLAKTVGHKIYFMPEVDFENNREWLRSTLVHELVHVWQYEHPFKFNKLDLHRYSYELNNDNNFYDYGMEQQASIIEDYYYATVLNYEDFPLCLDCSNLSKELIIDQLSYLYYQMLAE